MGATWSASFGGAAVSAMRVYDEVLVPHVFAPWARTLIDLLEVARGEAVLDVACGPGSVARVAAERVGADGRVTACDLSPAMLAVAQAKSPVPGAAQIAYLEAPADGLPVADAEFDVTTCQQGLQFFPDPLAALAEMRRALRPGGRVGIAVWTEIERSPACSALANAIGQVSGEEVAQRYRGGPWGLPSAEALGTLLQQVGFVDVQITKRVLPVTFDQGPVQLVASLAASGVAEEIDKLSAEQKDLLLASLVRATGNGAINSEMESNVAIARR
jgi:SAM-dependent methyltransferase